MVIGAIGRIAGPEAVQQLAQKGAVLFGIAV